MLSLLFKQLYHCLHKYHSDFEIFVLCDILYVVKEKDDENA